MRKLLSLSFAVLTTCSGISILAQEAHSPAPPAGTRQEADKSREMIGMTMNMLSYENPEKFEELKKLRESNPEKFQTELKKAADEIIQKRKAQADEFKKIAEDYSKTKSEESKTKLRAILSKQYEERLAMEEKNIARMEEHVKNAKAKLEEFKTKREEMINDRINKIAAVKGGEEKAAPAPQPPPETK